MSRKSELTRDDLPDSLLPAKVRATEGVELATLARRSLRLTPLPEGGYPEGILKRMANLAPYKGRTLKGNEKSLANLRRRMENPIPLVPVVIPPGLPQPNIPVAKLPPEMDPIKKRYLKACLTKEEFDLYAMTWKKWMEGHDDYNQVEDEEDVSTICMETVLQFRINLLRIAKPTADYSIEYNQSYRRMQQARENLAARRVDREGTAAGKGGKGGKTTVNNRTINVAIMSGQVDERKILELQREAHKQLQGDAASVGGMRDSAELMRVLEGEAVEVKPEGEETAE